MQIPQIQITTTDIKMDLNITDGVQHIEQPAADIRMEQPAAIVEIHTKRPVLHTDMSQFWEDVGLKPTGKLIQEYAQKGSDKLLQGISRRAKEGRQMMLGAGKDQGANTIKSIAMQNHGPKRAGPINIKFIPSYRAIKTSFEPGSIDINIKRQYPKIDVTVNKPIHDYTVGDVSGTMLVRPEVHIDVIG